METVGISVPRVDALEKVTGRAVYGTDIALPGMLHAKVLRSPHPHARLLKVDGSKAEKHPGVVCVLTREDLTDIDPYYGSTFKDQPIVAIEKARYVGDPVAAVVAEDEGTAEEALELIEVNYEELPAVFTIEEALADDAPLVHESVRKSGQFPDLEAAKPVQGTNICRTIHYEKGDVTAGFAQSDLVVEDSYSFPMVYHYSMEPFVSVARVSGGEITVWTGTQNPFPVRNELAEMFSVPLSRVRVIVPYVGGAYGSKVYTKIEPLAVALARKAGRPVRLALSIEESIKTLRAHSAICRIKTGFKKDGTMMARECNIYLNNGAYADVGPRVAQKGALRIPGPYKTPHTRVNGCCVYTNTVPAGAYRGFSSPQVAFASESQLDTIAERVGLDPLEFRLKNLLERNEEYYPNDRPIDGELRLSLTEVAKGIEWDLTSIRPNRGKGLAVAFKDAGGTPIVSTAIARLHNDSTMTVLTSTVELGQGSSTALRQIAADELGVPPDNVSLVSVDTSVTPFGPGSSASRSTTLSGIAVQWAVHEVKQKLIKITAELFGVPLDQVRVEKGRIIIAERNLSISEVMNAFFGMTGGELIGSGDYTSPRGKGGPHGAGTTASRTPFWENGAGGAEVEVDPETGEVRILRYVTSADVGKAINPQQCEGQDEGAALQGIGHTLFEELLYQDGQLLNPNLVDYRVPTFANLPEEFHSILIENRDGPGPYGAKGVSETGVVPVGSAVANAIYRATGVRIKELPLTPERVWRALRQGKTH